ncbi:MAG: sensor histidine kinase [Lachnospiraceae bacterium]
MKQTGEKDRRTLRKMYKDKLSLRTLLTLQYLICVAILLFIQFCVVNIILYPRQAEREKQLMQNQVESEAEKVGAVFYRELGVITGLSQTYALMDMDFYEYRDYVQKVGSKLVYVEDKNARRLLLCDTDKKAYLENGSQIDLSGEPFFNSLWQQGDKNGIYYLADTDMGEGEKDWLIAAALLLDKEGKNNGYLLSCFEAEESLSSFSTSIFPEDAAVWLTDSEGELLWKNVQGNELLNMDNDSGEKSADILMKNSGESSGLYQVSLDKQKTVGFAEIPKTYGWKLYMVWNNIGLDTYSEQYAGFSWLLWTVLISLLTAVAFCIAANVIRPMEQLTDIIQKMDERDSMPVKQHFFIREIEHLAQSINGMQSRINQLFDNMVKKEEAKRNVERKMLQAQITPHFLYNTLDNISWRAISCGNCQIPDIISALSTFFHISLSDGREFITWNEEAEHIYSYLFIQQMRYEDRLDFDLDLDQSIKDYYVIKLLLQPLVENALYHGIKPKEGRGCVRISIKKEEENQIYVLIEDDGVGMTSERLEQVRRTLMEGVCDAGFGLCTTLKRLKFTYGESCSFTIDSKEGRGTTIEISLPLETERRENG